MGRGGESLKKNEGDGGEKFFVALSSGVKCLIVCSLVLKKGTLIMFSVTMDACDFHTAPVQITLSFTFFSVIRMLTCGLY